MTVMNKRLDYSNYQTSNIIISFKFLYKFDKSLTNPFYYAIQCYLKNDAAIFLFLFI